MGKDPAFLFYPGDWNLGTMHMTFLERGCYIQLLMLQFARDTFTIEDAKHMLNGSFEVAWPKLVEKFKTDGIYFWNQRLKEEKEKRQKFSESRRANGLNRKTGKAKDKQVDKHMLKHMENEDKNENESIIKKENTDSVCYNIEDFLLKNQKQFEKICMTTGKKAAYAKDQLHLYHLWMTEKEQYPYGNIAGIAGFEKWLLNSNNFKQNGTNGNSHSVGRTIEFDKP